MARRATPSFEDEQYREVRQTDLAGGLNDKRNQARLDPSQTPDCTNVEFDTESVVNAGGAIKFGNEPAPGGAIRTHASMAPLYVRSTPVAGSGNGLLGAVDVPLRGALYFPYSQDTDVGGRFDYEGSRTSAASFHNRRGTSFEINVSFQLPPEEKLYEAPTPASTAPAVPAAPMNPPHGFDTALDECVCILQKGGDRTACMSWALAIVNVGTAVGITNIPAQRASNYCLAFIWYDAPQWGEHAATAMRYDLTTAENPTTGPNTQLCTQAYRTILIGKFIEPGRDYNVAIQLSMDTGSPGSSVTDTAWVQDGAFKVYLWEDRRTWWYATATNTSVGVITQTSSDTGSPARLEVVRGPTDSLEYLCKYGVRFAGRDAVFAGLGMRFTPWARAGFIPFGSDCTPMRSGGFAMLDRSLSTVADLYGAATYTLTAQHTAADAFVVINHQGVSNGNTNGGFDPKTSRSGTVWEGLGGGGGPFNANALRGYRLVTTENWAATQQGAILTLLDYFEVGASYRLNIYDGANVASFGTFTAANQFVLIQCWRWHQRDLVVGQIGFSLSPTNYQDADPLLASRRKLGLRMSHVVGDPTDDRLPTLAAYYPCDDAGSTYLREVISGGLRSGYRFPFANGVGPGGTRGKNLVFLSGEGEALTLNLSESEVFVREMERMLRGFTQGFGFEITCVFTEAFYSLQGAATLVNVDGVVVNGAQPLCVPDIVTLDIADTEGSSTPAKPLLTLGFRAPQQSGEGHPFIYPAAFGVTTAVYSDSEDQQPIQHAALQPWYLNSTPAARNRYSVDAPWVGKTVTIQVGVQRSFSLGEYDVYIAMTPKSAFLPQDGDPSNVEMQYWTDDKAVTSDTGDYGSPAAYYNTAHFNIRPKDLARAVLTVGGAWRAKESISTPALGEHELNARMLIDEVRWFVAAPSGELGAYANQVVTMTQRNGKLEGTNCLPPRELGPDDLLQPLGPNARSVNVTQGSATVTTNAGGAFPTATPRSSLSAVQGCFLRLVMDDTLIAEEESLGELEPNYSYVLSNTSTSIMLATAYPGLDRSNAAAGVFRLAGYTSFADDVRDAGLYLGRGGGYGVNSANDDRLLTNDLWANLAVPGDSWRLRIFSPLGAQGSAELLPSWTRGLVFERRIDDDGILGIHGWNGRIYCGARGSIFEADDRWRPDGPSDELLRSLAFRAREYPAGISGPLQRDSLLYGTISNARYIASTTDAYAYLFDVWVKLDSIREYQTVVYLGALESNPALNASSTGNKLHYWWRFNDGRPELIFGSTETYDGTNVPEKGLYIAQGATAIPAGEWVHVRWSVPTTGGGVTVRVPYCQVNGKNVGVTVNAHGSGLSGTDWITAASIVSANTGSGVPTSILVGAARDAYRAPEPTVEFVASTAGLGTLTQPQRIQGLMHALGGRVAQIAITRQTVWAGSGAPPNFDPFLLNYDTPSTVVCFAPDIQGLGVGHRVGDLSGTTPGTIYSSPFVSVFHEMGTSRELFSFAEYGTQLYVTNGGKPVVVFTDA